MLLIGKAHVSERIGTAFLFGIGISTLLMFCLSLLGIRITLISTMLTLVVGNICLVLLVKILKRSIYTRIESPIKIISKLSKLEKVVAMVIALLVIGSLVVTIYFPVNAWDSLVLYDFRARIIAQEGFYAQIAKNFTYFDGYPLFTSLSHTFVYLFKGTNPQFIYSLIYASFVSVFYANIRKFTSRKVSLVSTLLLATTPLVFEHSTIAYTNLSYTVFLVLGFIYLFVWFTKKLPIGYLINSAILMGLSTWTRSAEPFWVINIILLIFISIYRLKKYYLSTIIYTIVFWLIKQPWSWVVYNSAKIGVGRNSPMVNEAKGFVTLILGSSLSWERLSNVTVYLYKNIVASWYPILYLFLLLIVLNFKNFTKRNSSLFLIVILLNFALLAFSTYIFTFGFSEWGDISDSARRMAMFFMPLMIFYMGLSLGDHLNAKGN